jgi:hypothetical protein
MDLEGLDDATVRLSVPTRFSQELDSVALFERVLPAGRPSMPVSAASN